MTAAPPHALATIHPGSCEPRDIYRLMTGIIVPRPVALVSTISPDGHVNLAPFSFFNGVGSAPPTVLFCPVLRSASRGEAGHRKDTLHNVEQTREFVINIVSQDMAPAANITAAEVGPEVDEFQLAGLTPLPSVAVRPPRVAESPAHMECRFLQSIYTSHAPGAGVIVLGEVLRFHVRQDLLDGFRVDPAGLDAVGRMSGNTWSLTRDLIELVRPVVPPVIPPR